MRNIIRSPLTRINAFHFLLPGIERSSETAANSNPAIVDDSITICMSINLVNTYIGNTSNLNTRIANSKQIMTHSAT